MSIPSTATEMVPVSSDTITTTASLASLIPTPARCRVPRSALRWLLSDRGSTQPAAAIFPSRIIMAPS